MEDFNKNFEDQWKKAFEDAEEEPSALLWQGLEHKLAEKELTVYKKKNLYLRVAAAILFILFSSTSAYFIYHYTYEDSIAHNTRNTDSGNLDEEKTNASGELAPTVNEPSSGEKNIAAVENKKDQLTQQKNHFTKTKENATVTTGGKKGKTDLSPTISPADTQHEFAYSEDKGTTERDISKAAVKRSRTNDQSIASSTPVKKNQIIITNNLTSEESEALGFGSNESLNSALLLSTLHPKGIPSKTSKIRYPLVITTSFPLSNHFDEEYASKKETKKTPRWYAGYDFTPTYTNQNFASTYKSTPQSFLSHNTGTTGASVDPSTSSRKSFLDELNKMESVKELEKAITPEFSYNSGLRGGYRLNKKLRIETGVNYVYTQSKVMTNYFAEDRYSNDQYPAFNVFFDENAGEDKSIGSYNSAEKLNSFFALNAAPPINEYKTAKIYTQYIGVPLTLNYHLINKRINVFIGGGISTDFFLQYGSKKDESEGFEKEIIKSSGTSSFKPIAFSLLITPEVEYEVTSKYSIYLRPMFKGALESYTDTKRISNRPNSTGVGFGLRYILD